MIRSKKRGQSVLEFTVLIVIIIGALIAMQLYVKRGLQGRWKSSIDDFGDQYDPRLANSSINYKVISNSMTSIQTIKASSGYYTQRVDGSNTVSTTQGSIAVGAEF